MADTSAAPTANGGGFVEATKANASDAYNSIANGPVATSTKDQAMKTSNEFSNLAGARKTPSYPAATGQPLTHYHSFFSELLAWNNPRASAIAYTVLISIIFAARYLDIIRWFFKFTWMALGTTIAAEVVGKMVMSNGFASQVRPRQYYMVPRETLDAMIGDVHELVNFFVIEAQRIVFAENVSASILAFASAFLSYYLVKIVPYWGLAIIFTTMAFFVPLAYTSNQELIDSQIKNASDIVNAQTAQVRSVAGKHTAHMAGMTKQYMGDYSAKAQQMIRGNRAPVKESDFPSAPAGDLKKEELHQEQEPLVGEEKPTPAM